MKPLQVYLDEAELARLDAWAQRRGWTKSQAVRAAVRALTRPAESDPVLAISGMIQDGLPEDSAAHFDRHLQATFVADAPASYAKRRRAPRTRARR
ncbi:MAG: CopG family transcriptional regulator [Candidatus Binatia bacterium]